MRKEILSEIFRIKEVMGIITEASSPLFNWIEDLFYNLATKNASFQEELTKASNILQKLNLENVISPSTRADRVGKNINSDEIIETIKTNGKFKVKLPNGTIIERNLTDLVDNETLIDVLKKYANNSPEYFRTMFREIALTNPQYLPDGVGDTVESLVKNREVFLSRGVEGKQAYKEFLDRLDELTTNSNMDNEIKDIVADFVKNEKVSIGIVPSESEIIERIRKTFQNKTGKKELPYASEFYGLKFKDGIKQNEIDDVVEEIITATEIKTVQELKTKIDEKLKLLGFDDARYKNITKNLIQQNCFEYYMKGDKMPLRTLRNFFIKKDSPNYKEAEKDTSKFKTSKCIIIPALLFLATISATSELTFADQGAIIVSKLGFGQEALGIKSSGLTKKYFKEYFQNEYDSVNNLLQDITVKEAVQGQVQTVTKPDGEQAADIATLQDVNKIAIKRGDEKLILGYDVNLGGEDYNLAEYWYVEIKGQKVFFPNLNETFWETLKKLNEFTYWLGKVNPTTKGYFQLAEYSVDYDPTKREYYMWSNGQPDTKVTYKEDNTDNQPNTEDDYTNGIIETFKNWAKGTNTGQWGKNIDEIKDDSGKKVWDIKLEGNKIVVSRILDPLNEFYEYEPDGENNFKLTRQKTPQKL